MKWFKFCWHKYEFINVMGDKLRTATFTYQCKKCNKKKIGVGIGPG